MRNTPESERRHEDEDLLHRRVDSVEQLIRRFEDTYIRSDMLTERLDRAKDRLEHLEQKFEEFSNERTWFIRLILGVNVLAVIGLVVQSKP